VRRLLLSAALAGFLLLSACGRSGAAPLALVASTPGTVGTGTQRVLLGLMSPEGEMLAAPDRETTAIFTSPRGETQEVTATFLWTVPDLRGLYVTRPQLDVPGTWQVALRPDDLPATDPVPFSVLDDVPLVEVGEPAPRSQTRTLADHALEEITTDPQPDPELYRRSLDQLLGSGQPVLVVFATPAFCQTATCGPALDLAKQVAAAHPEVELVHVEVYENLDAASVADLRPVKAVSEWGLPSEPWLYVVDGEGIVAARFEGTFAPEEVEETLADLGQRG
jgi:hypothetical protein